MPSDIIELIPRKNFFREESLPQTSEDIINLWLYFLATNFSKDYIFRQNDILESNNIIVAPPFIVSFYELQKLISKLGKQDQGLNIEFNRVKFFINHDIIKHLICCQNISILSDKTNQVIESIVSNDPNLNEFYPNNFYPFLTEVELTQQFTDFRKKTMDKESLAFAIFTTFSKKYPELKKNFEIITSSPVETKISTKFSNLEIQQFQAVLLDFQRWQVLRGNIKAIRLKFGKSLLSNIINPSESFEQSKEFRKIKTDLILLGQSFKQSIKENTGQFNFYENMGNAVDNIILEKQWNELSVLVLQILNNSESEKVVQRFAINFNELNGLPLSSF